jgi:hypothetical protein
MTWKGMIERENGEIFEEVGGEVSEQIIVLCVRGCSRDSFFFFLLDVLLS